jgi:SAM-dependent methyltransferase
VTGEAAECEPSTNFRDDREHISGSGQTTLDEVRHFWDADAATYDRAPTHRPRSPAVLAAWTAAIERLLPPTPARILDAGAGTGFLSLLAARLGHRVTAVDISPGMLEQLERSARREGLDVAVEVGPAHEVSTKSGPFDAVVERHLLWTLPDPAEALSAWRGAAENGRLVLFESVWGSVDQLESVRARARRLIRKARGEAPEHHASYRPQLRESLPLGTGTDPSKLVELVVRTGWRNPRLERLRDVEWSERLELGVPERLAGVSPRFVVRAD